MPRFMIKVESMELTKFRIMNEEGDDVSNLAMLVQTYFNAHSEEYASLLDT